MGKTSLGYTKATEGSGTITTRSKFKMYSERKKVNHLDEADSKPSKTSLEVENRTQLASNMVTNTARVCAGGDLTRSTHDYLDKTKARRNALADVSNIRGHPSRFEKPRSSLSFGTATAISSLSLAGNTLSGCAKPKEGFGPRKYVTNTSKFKVYSERKVNHKSSDDADSKSSRTSLVLENMTQFASNTTTNKASVQTSVAELTKSSHGCLDKTKAQRKTLAGVSNIRGRSSRFDKPRSSLLFGTATASSSQTLGGKSKAKLTRGVVASNTSGKATVNTKALRTSSNFHRDQVNEIGFVSRQTSKSSNAITRKSFPVLKRASHLASSDIQVSTRSVERSAIKVGFPVKSRAGGKLVTQPSNLKVKVLVGKANDGFTLKTMKNEKTKGALGGVRNSVKPIARPNLRTSNGQKNFKFGRNDSLNKSLGCKSTRRAKVVTNFAESSEPNASCVEVTESGNPAQGSDQMKPESSDIMVSKNSGRRKSYITTLISRAKVLELRNEVRELDQVPNIDDEDNPLEVAEYVDDIYEYYWIMEAQCTPLGNYLMIQTDVTSQMRGLLINWLIEVHHKFELMPETLYLTVTLLDRYLTIVTIKKKELQLVGLASLLLASKYEDFWHPLVRDLISISAESYTREQMLEMEKNILKKLRFRLNLPTAYVFMLRFLKASQSDKKHEDLAFYLIELCLVEYETLKFRPSLLCASAVYVARCTLNEVPAWTSLLRKHARYEEFQIRDCAEMILQIHKTASASLLKVTYDKYMHPKLGRVAAIKPLDSLPY